MKKIKISCIGIVIIIVLLLSWYLIDRFSYSNPQPYYSVKATHNTTLTIGIIGDSWVSNGKLDSLIHNKLLEKGFENKVLSSGHPGARSKIIYQNLFKEKEKEQSSKFIIENHPDYCVLVSGVNDAISQVGSNFYTHHVVLIVNTLLHYKITPVIVELPEFGIVEATNELGFIPRERDILSAKFTNSGEIDNIRTYREALVRELEVKNLKDSVILIGFDKVCDDYSKYLELYFGSSHLSKKGNEKFSQIITNELCKRINSINKIQPHFGFNR